MYHKHTTSNKVVIANWILANYKKLGLRPESLLPLLPLEVRFRIYRDRYSSMKEVHENNISSFKGIY